MVIKTKQIVVAMICAVFIIGIAVVSKVSADGNPFKPSGSDSFIKTVSMPDDGKCGSYGGGSDDSRVGGEQESKCGSSDVEDAKDDHHHAKCGGPAGGTHDSRVGGEQESKCGSSDVENSEDDHHHAKCGGPAGGTHDSRVGEIGRASCRERV